MIYNRNDVRICHLINIAWNVDWSSAIFINHKYSNIDNKLHLPLKITENKCNTITAFSRHTSFPYLPSYVYGGTSRVINVSLILRTRVHFSRNSSARRRKLERAKIRKPSYPVGDTSFYLPFFRVATKCGRNRDGSRNESNVNPR